MKSKRLMSSWVAVSVMALVVLSACSGGGQNDGKTDSEGQRELGLQNVGEAPKPVKGGVLTMAAYSEISSLDPVIATGTGSAGSTELTAIYDVLMVYDIDANDYVPKLAQALDASDDFKSWTLELREGVTFSDGTPLDADAVVFSLNRYVENKGRLSAYFSKYIEDIAAKGDTTVEITMKRPWAHLSWLFSQMPGNIVAPSAAESLGDDFGRNPVGAGAFVLDRYAPGEILVLSGREDYWDGEPYLDEVRFIQPGGAAAHADTLNTGQANVSILRDPAEVQKLLNDDQPGYLDRESLGLILAINNEPGRPGSDIRVRKAIAAALDPEAYNERVFGGHGFPDSRIFFPPQRWATEADGPKYDVDHAKELVEELKSEGFDGKLNLVTFNSQEGLNRGLTAEAMLDAVGFDVTVDSSNSIEEYIGKVRVKGEYDIAPQAPTVTQDNVWTHLELYFHSKSSGNFFSYSDKEMDQLLDRLSEIPTDDAKETQQILEEIQKRWTETVPSVALTAMPFFGAWARDVHGIIPSVGGILNFEKAFIATN